jgi:hypothetical protein
VSNFNQEETLHMKKLVLGLLVSSVASLFTGCGSDDDKGSGSKPSAAQLASGEGCADQSGMGAASDCDTSSYANCLETQCSAQYQGCLGAGYKSGDLSGGRCEEFMNCTLASADPCSATDCVPSDDCTACLSEIANCAFGAACELPECAGGGAATPGASPTSGGGCAALMTCCASLTGTDQTDCNDTMNSLGGLDQACDAALSIYQASGTCQ